MIIKHKIYNFDINKILLYLPHRFPFLLIDRVLSFQKKNFLKAIKNITANDFFFMGHFPKNFIFPGVLIVESLAQASCLLLIFSQNNLNSNYKYYLSSIQNTYFINSVYPGDQVLVKVILQKSYSNISKFTAIATVNQKTVCRSILLLSCIKHH